MLSGGQVLTHPTPAGEGEYLYSMHLGVSAFARVDKVHTKKLKCSLSSKAIHGTWYESSHPSARRFGRVMPSGSGGTEFTIRVTPDGRMLTGRGEEQREWHLYDPATTVVTEVIPG